MPEVIEAQHILQHLSQNGAEFFTLTAGVAVRYEDVVHYNGRKYIVQRVEQVQANGSTIVRAAYRSKL